MFKVSDTRLFSANPFDDTVEVFLYKYNALTTTQKKEIRIWLKTKKYSLTVEIDKLENNLSRQQLKTSKNVFWSRSGRNRKSTHLGSPSETRKLEEKKWELNRVFSLEVAIYWNITNSQTWHSNCTYIQDGWFSKFTARSFNDGPWTKFDIYIVFKVEANGGYIHDPDDKHLHFYFDSDTKQKMCHYKNKGFVADIPSNLQWAMRYIHDLGQTISPPIRK